MERLKGYTIINARICRETEKAYEIELMTNEYIYRPYLPSMWVPKSVCIVETLTAYDGSSMKRISQVKNWYYHEYRKDLDRAREI